MDTLFSGFDLTVKNSSIAEPKVKKNPASASSSHKNPKITNQNLFSETLSEFNIELNKPEVTKLVNK